jgi:hypothetical protein
VDIDFSGGTVIFLNPQIGFNYPAEAYFLHEQSPCYRKDQKNLYD